MGDYSSAELHVLIFVSRYGHHCDSYEKLVLRYLSGDGLKKSLEKSISSTRTYKITGLNPRTGYTVYADVYNNENLTSASSSMYIFIPAAAGISSDNIEHKVMISLLAVACVVIAVLVAVIIRLVRRSHERQQTKNSGVTICDARVIYENAPGDSGVITVEEGRGYQTEEQHVYEELRGDRDKVADYASLMVTKCSTGEFDDYFRKLTNYFKDSKQTKLQLQFEHLLLNLSSLKVKVSSVALRNKKKNRSLHHLPAEQGRVILRTSEAGKNNYINAVYAENFIVTQWPLSGTVEDFWRMIYEQKCSTVVLLTSTDRNKKVKEYWPDGSIVNLVIGPFQLIPVIVQYPRSDIIIREFRLVKDSNEGSTRTIKHFQYTSWPVSANLPANRDSFLQLLQMVEESSFGHNGPITVHDIDGGSHCGIFCMISSARAHIKTTNEVNLFQMALSICQNRPQLLRHLEEYRFCHEMILRCIQEDGAGVSVDYQSVQ